ncbi:MAG: hypothetical protein J2P22_07725, partial [Nocardioides sp.]|nr:hypothetical protein [Nocardioides sp.]
GGPSWAPRRGTVSTVIPGVVHTPSGDGRPGGVAPCLGAALPRRRSGLWNAPASSTLHPYPHDPRAASYGLEAAGVLGVEPARVFKTLLAEADGRLVVGGPDWTVAGSG